MTIQEAFERGHFVRFYNNSPYVIMVFRNETLCDELHETLFDEIKDKILCLEIQIIDNDNLQLLITSKDGNLIYKSNSLPFYEDELENFKNRFKDNTDITFYTDYEFNNGYPKNKWQNQNGQQFKRIMLYGYKITP